MDNPWHEPILFFPGENPEELKTRFVNVWARYQNRSAYEVAQHVFKDLRDPVLRAGKAAEVWSKELDVLERVRVLVARGPVAPTPSKEEAVNLLWARSQDPLIDPKEQINAIKVMAEIEGWIKKGDAKGGSGGSDANSADFLKALAEKLPN